MSRRIHYKHDTALFPSTIGTQPRSAKFLTTKSVVRKNQRTDGQTGSRCLDKAMLAQGGGGVRQLKETQGKRMTHHRITTHIWEGELGLLDLVVIRHQVDKYRAGWHVTTRSIESAAAQHTTETSGHSTLLGC